MFVFLVTKQVADHTDANDGKVITDDGTKKLDTLASLITKQVADHAAAIDIKDGVTVII